MGEVNNQKVKNVQTNALIAFALCYTSGPACVEVAIGGVFINDVNLESTNSGMDTINQLYALKLQDAGCSNGSWDTSQ